MSGYGVEFGALCDDIEVQLQRQGFTLGDRAVLFQRWSTEISSLRIHGLLTESESDRARKRLWKELTATVKPLPSKETQP